MHPVLLDCCGGLNNVDFSKMDVTFVEDVLNHINLRDSSFFVAVAAIIFNPFFWNVVARWEHRTRGLSRLFGSPYLACYFLGFVIILLNVYRSHSMTVAMKAQARWGMLERTEVFCAGVALMVFGTVLVVSSFIALGFIGTFLGDYFGILMDERVTGFPFNITENPMYWGSTANYLGLALIGASPIGLVLTCMVAIVYSVAIRFEGVSIGVKRMMCCWFNPTDVLSNMPYAQAAKNNTEDNTGDQVAASKVPPSLFLLLLYHFILAHLTDINNHTVFIFHKMLLNTSD